MNDSAYLRLRKLVEMGDKSAAEELLREAFRKQDTQAVMLVNALMMNRRIMKVPVWKQLQATASKTGVIVSIPSGVEYEHRIAFTHGLDSIRQMGVFVDLSPMDKNKKFRAPWDLQSLRSHKSEIQRLESSGNPELDRKTYCQSTVRQILKKANLNKRFVPIPDTKEYETIREQLSYSLFLLDGWMPVLFHGQNIPDPEMPDSFLGTFRALPAILIWESA